MKFLAVFLFVLGVVLHCTQGELYTKEDYRNFRKTCGKLLRTSHETLTRVEQNGYSEEPEMLCLVRCVSVLTKFYDDETGTNWETLALDLAGKEGFEEYKNTMKECVKALDHEEDHCKRAYQHFQCGLKARKTHFKDNTTTQ